MIDVKDKMRALIILGFFYCGIFGIVRKLAFHFSLPFLKREKKKPLSFVVKRRHYQNIQILAYHRVTERTDNYFTPILPKYFERQMAYLVEKFRVISADECVERLQRKDVPPNCIVVTFDDGYRDNYTEGFPILKKYAIPATIFLATGCLDGKQILWHDQVCFAIKQTRERILDLKEFNGKVYDLSNPTTKENALYGVLWRLREISNDERIQWTKIILERLACEEDTIKGAGKTLMLNWDDLRKLKEGGINFGAHTVTHPILSQSPLETARREITDSKGEIESKLQVRVRLFAYPSGRRGDFNEPIKHLVKEQGFSSAFSMIYGVNESGDDGFELRRIPVGNWDVPYFAKELMLSKF